MRYLALCCDYDGTIAHDGTVDAATLAALERLRSSGRHLVLVTGRELDDLQRVCPRLDLFERVVAENGALLYRPDTGEEKCLGEPPPAEFVAELRARGVARVSVGRVIVATWEPHQHQVLQVIRDLGLELQVIFNKGAVMVLPAGINKASGLKCALAEMGLSVHNAIGVGDAENDHAFLSVCECAVAVANALPALKERADIVTRGDHGSGVAELIDQLLDNELADFEARLARHHIKLGCDAQGAPVCLSPYGINALVVGTSGGGKSTVAVGLVERLRAADYSFCIIDPEGDYDNVDSAVVLGSPDHVPTLDECAQLICKPANNAVINLLGLKLEDRPAFFLSLFARVTDIRARTGRPHLLIVDEAHHVLPARWQPAKSHVPEHFAGVLLVSVTPSLIAPCVLRAVDTVIVLGEKPRETLQEFAAAKHSSVIAPAQALDPGTALLWNKDQPAPLLVHLEPSRTERRRHLRKYAEGELPPDRSFYFRGPQGKLKLRAHNLILFMDLADGVDDETWRYHLQRGEISAWIAEHIKDPGLAQQIMLIERERDLPPATSRQRVRAAIQALYTLPAAVNSG
jgi:hydroxymethylpyrimidine pyrophosphatase-like HAD family hydrolase